eukprot:TRINITY_DN9444_c0_g1_i1.p1 TRINITY_DN9444_c0_g1~~TRINITY_DN9444_c0_g1_i1.p1  ORF type:complete len:400 (+),score=66.39 TRINITY_DN9444_c0_g1_i1:37-1236(+)
MDNQEGLVQPNRDWGPEFNIHIAGWLNKKPPKNRPHMPTKKWKKRWFVLENLVLSYWKSPEAVQNPKDILGVVDLRQCQYICVDRTPDSFLFLISIPNRKYTLSADSEEERTMWCKAISQFAMFELQPDGAKIARIGPNRTEIDLSAQSIDALPCSLYSSNSIVNLNLSENSLSSLPSVICSLTTLEILDLSYNHLKILPENIGQLKNLKLLNLHRNSIPMLPDSFTGLESILDIDLGQNSIKDVNGLINLHTLRRLTLSFNPEIVIPDNLNTPDLTLLDLTGTGLDILPNYIGNFIHLQVFEAMNNNIENIPEGMFENLTVLKQLRLSRNRIQNLPAAIAHIPTLEELEVSFNQIRHLDPSFALSSAFIEIHNNPLELPAEVVAGGSNHIKEFLASQN